MNGRFLFFGIFISVAIHAVFLFVLSFSSSSTLTPSDEVTASATSDQTSPVPEAAPETPPVRPASLPVKLPDTHPLTVQESAPTPEVEWVTYTVKKGDWLERLCKKAGCSISEVVRYNKTTYKKLSNLKVGQKIKLPKFHEN